MCEALIQLVCSLRVQIVLDSSSGTENDGEQQNDLLGAYGQAVSRIIFLVAFRTSIWVVSHLSLILIGNHLDIILVLQINIYFIRLQCIQMLMNK